MAPMMMLGICIQLNAFVDIGRESPTLGSSPIRRNAMPQKSVPLSARIAQEDAEFIAKLSIEGATTPSDKLRAIIADARRRSEGTQDYGAALLLAQDSLAPALRRLREAEHQHRMHSELLSRTFAWLPEMVAFMMSVSTDGDNLEKRLKEAEKGVADRLFTLMQSVLQMGVTARCACYDANAITSRLDAVLDLADVIMKTRQTKQER